MIDMTLKITPQMMVDAQEKGKKVLIGHLGTHFDATNKEFPLEYAKRKGIIFDITSIGGRDIALSDIDISKVEKDMFVAFYSGYIEKMGYGSKAYFTEHPQLSNELIESILDRGVSLIGIDFAGVRRGKEHGAKDRYCADRGVFIIENLCNLQSVLASSPTFLAYTFPMHYAEMSGIPCRVIAEV